MKTIFTLLSAIVLFAGNVFAQANQTVRFTYDASGNRTQRFIEVKEVKQTAGDTAEFLLPEFKPTGEALLLSDAKVFPNPL